MRGDEIDLRRSLRVRGLGACAAVCLAGAAACVGASPLTVGAPGSAGAMSAGGGPGGDGGQSDRGTGGASAGSSACKTHCPSGQTCSAGKCALCDGFVMPNPASAALPNPASYAVAAGVVTDMVTGLRWEQNPPSDGYVQPTAATYCANNRTGGLSSWRLPTVIELVSLLDFTVPFPATSIDGSAFPNTAAEKFWTSTAFLLPGSDRIENAYVLDFGYSRTDSSALTGADVAVRVRCVAPPAGGPSCYPPPRFTVTGTASAGTVADASTKLVWQRGFSSAMTWESAKRYCSNAPFRLPTLKELQTIVDYTIPIPETTINATAFPKTPNDYFWTSSPAAGLPGKAWIVSFSSGATFTMPTGDSWRVRCVK